MFNENKKVMIFFQRSQETFQQIREILELERQIGEILDVAGNTLIEMGNMGVAILDMLLKSSKINKLQYNQMYKKRLYVE